MNQCYNGVCCEELATDIEDILIKYLRKDINIMYAIKELDYFLRNYFDKHPFLYNHYIDKNDIDWTIDSVFRLRYPLTKNNDERNPIVSILMTLCKSSNIDCFSYEN